MHIMHSHNRFILHLNKSLWIKDGRGTLSTEIGTKQGESKFLS